MARVEHERIVTRCPACGYQTLFVGNGGHLTCSLIGCPNPAVEDYVGELREKANRYDSMASWVLRPVEAVGEPQSVAAVDPVRASSVDPSAREKGI